MKNIVSLERITNKTQGGLFFEMLKKSFLQEKVLGSLFEKGCASKNWNL